jgi:hypothetical protein
VTWKHVLALLIGCATAITGGLLSATCPQGDPRIAQAIASASSVLLTLGVTIASGAIGHAGHVALGQGEARQLAQLAPPLPPPK